MKPQIIVVIQKTAGIALPAQSMYLVFIFSRRFYPWADFMDE